MYRFFLKITVNNRIWNLQCTLRESFRDAQRRDSVELFAGLLFFPGDGLARCGMYEQA